MKKTMILLAALAVSMSASALDLQDYVLGGARPKGIGAVTPAMDGKYYYQIVDGGKTIARYAYKTGRREATVLDSLPMQTAQVKRWDGYQMSQSESAILLWADSEPIYRHSFTARFFVYDCKNRQIKAVANDQPVQIATLSPDGERVAYVTGNNVYVQRLADGNITQVTTDGRKNHVINAVPDWVYEEEFAMLNSFAWSSDSRTLSFIRWDESQVPMYSMTMYEGDCKPNEDYALYPGSYDYKYPVAGEKNAVVSVHSYDVTTAKLSKMDVPLAQDDYVPHIGYAGPADALMVMKLNRTQNDMHIYRVNPATGAARDIYHETSASWIDSEMSRNVAYYDNFLVIPNETSGYCQLYQYDLDGKLMRQLTTGQEPVTAYYGYDSKNRMFYYQCTDGPLNRVVRRVDAKGRVQDVEVAKGTNSATFNSDFTYYIHAFSNVDTPTQYRLKQVGRKGSVRDLQLNDDYCAKYMVPEVPRREFVTFENDGYTLNGFIIKPVDFDPSKKYPVIMSQYSGPGSQQVRNNWKLDWEEYFATQGYIVACFDGRGTGARGKAFESLIYQNLGHYETIDQVAAAQYMASQPWVDAERIGIWGWSFGGYEVLMAMSHPDSHYAAGVSIAPVTSWRFYDTIYAERFMRTPQENPDGYAQSAPLDKVKDLKGELLIMFGSADDNVHIINAMQYIAKLHGQKRQFDMMVYPNMNHSINGCGVREPLYQRVLNYFNRTLKR
ncbi:MAG: DPP IV N-terminal domain-containing protein [Muribaculaceae bacterium]|nr:DPP IV N-terminal domain-containing protein [Muribaculaceae bacterium]